MYRSRRHALPLIVPLVALLVAAGCGDDDEATVAEISTESEAAPDAEAESEDEVVADGEIEVVAVDYAFQELPERVAAGTRLTLRNDADAELHEIVAFGLPEDEIRTADEIAALPEAELASLFQGPPAFVLLAPPGEESFAAVGDGTLEDPGRYLVFCAIPTGADPREYLRLAEESPGPPDVPGGPPHFTQGMYGEVVAE
jgi:hypothetical protein